MHSRTIPPPISSSTSRSINPLSTRRWNHASYASQSINVCLFFCIFSFRYLPSLCWREILTEKSWRKLSYAKAKGLLSFLPSFLTFLLPLPHLSPRGWVEADPYRWIALEPTPKGNLRRRDRIYGWDTRKMPYIRNSQLNNNSSPRPLINEMHAIQRRKGRCAMAKYFIK